MHQLPDKPFREQLIAGRRGLLRHGSPEARAGCTDRFPGRPCESYEAVGKAAEVPPMDAPILQPILPLRHWFESAIIRD